MESKKLGVIILIILAFGAGVYYFADIPWMEIDNEQIIENEQKENNQNLSKENFQKNLLETTEVYIIMDTRNVKNSTISDGILQCGVDFAGSQGISGKNITIIAFQDNECIGLSNESMTVNACMEQIKNKIYIHITSNNKTKYFEDKLIVSIDEPYEAYSCQINIKEN